MAFPTDEDLLNMPDNEARELPESKAVIEENKDKKPDDEDEEHDKTEEEKEEEEDKEEDEEDSEDTDDSEEKSEESEDDKEDDKGDESDTESKDNETKAKEDEKEEDKDDEKDIKDDSDKQIDYKAEYERILAPFKANNRNIQVNNVDDAITLMRMGANYNKKMAGLKPSLRFVKILQNAELLDENKLNYLIDLTKHDKNAITKLLADSGLDPHDLTSDESKKVEYTPTKHSNVTEADIDLDQVLDDLRESKTYTDTIRVASKEWDDESRAIIAQDPAILRVLDQHMQTGIYGKIADVMASEKAVGKLAGVPDIVAYKQVGDALNAAGAFGSDDSTDSSAVSKSQDKKDPEKEEKRKNSRKSASPTRKSSAKKSGKKSADFNPLDMPDDEFEKAAAEGLYN